MNKFINITAEILSILIVSIVFAIVFFHGLRATHFFTTQQLENITICASLFVCFFGCVVINEEQKAAQL